MPIDFPNSPSNGQEHTVGSTTWTYDGAKWNIKTVSAVTNDGMPVGAIMWFAGSATPAGWLPCNGASYTTSIYPTLYAVIGYTFGGSGVNFNVPTISATTGGYYIRYTTALGAIETTTSLITAPVGSMIDWPTTSSYPTGWIRADGSAVSRTTYNDLFVLIGTTYGVGDNSTTFNLPNIVQAGAGSPVTIIKATLSGAVEPSTVAHASSHIRGGADVIDGDRLSVDFVPTRYTRNSAASGAGDATDLTAHLSGIDNNLISLWTPPSCRVYRTTSQSLTNATTVALQFDNESWDTSNFHNNITNNTRLTVATAGIYMLVGNVNIAVASSTGTYRLAVIRKNGSTELGFSNGAIVGDSRVSVSVIDYANANDYYELCVYQDGGTTGSLNALSGFTSLFSIVYVST